MFYTISDENDNNAPEIEEDKSKLLSNVELINLLNSHFEIIPQGQLVIEFKLEDNIYFEKSRGFILDNKWPFIK